jgi:hypothetical protein
MPTVIHEENHLGLDFMVLGQAWPVGWVTHSPYLQNNLCKYIQVTVKVEIFTGILFSLIFSVGNIQ